MGWRRRRRRRKAAARSITWCECIKRRAGRRASLPPLRCALQTEMRVMERTFREQLFFLLLCASVLKGDCRYIEVSVGTRAHTHTHLRRWLVLKLSFSAEQRDLQRWVIFFLQLGAEERNNGGVNVPSTSTWVWLHLHHTFITPALCLMFIMLFYSFYCSESFHFIFLISLMWCHLLILLLLLVLNVFFIVCDFYHFPPSLLEITQTKFLCFYIINVVLFHLRLNFVYFKCLFCNTVFMSFLLFARLSKQSVNCVLYYNIFLYTLQNLKILLSILV